jgi:hypothetical protein
MKRIESIIFQTFLTCFTPLTEKKTDILRPAKDPLYDLRDNVQASMKRIDFLPSRQSSARRSDNDNDNDNDAANGDGGGGDIPRIGFHVRHGDKSSEGGAQEVRKKKAMLIVCVLVCFFVCLRHGD